ncbi:alpha/beta hydrolase family protein [Streptomyces seoulensis]|uniref:alpha/beta hydrolase family protein n=1 Tax=Streptomyces seoulensis TaxID=73044 RepID=UPI0033A13017
MSSLRFTTESSSDGILERDFTVGDIPGVLWSPASAGPAPLVLMGHGGGADKRHRAMVGRARLLVTRCGFHAAVIDAPGHGDRPRSARDEEDVAALRRAQAAGSPEAPAVVPYNVRLAEQAVPEYRATLDALQELPDMDER